MEKENKNQLAEELEELRIRLQEAEETISAIRGGEVDGIIISGLQGEQVFTKTGAEQAYRLLIEAMNEGAVSLNQKGMILYCNHRFAEMVKTPLERVIGAPLRQFVWASDQPLFDDLIKKKAQEPGKGELVLIQNDGTVLPVLFSVSASQTDHVRAIVVTDLTAQKHIEDELKRHREHLEELVKDRTSDLETSNQQLQEEIAERKRAEDSLKESNERIRLLLDSTAEGIYGQDLQGNCTFVNRSSLRLLGFAKGENLLGKSMHALIHHTRPDGTPCPQQECSIHQSIASGKAVHIDDDLFWRPDRTSFPVEYWSYPMCKDGAHIGVVVTFMDTTERKQAEEEMAKLQSQLNQAQKMEAIGTLAGGIAHDFNNILAAIMGLTQLALLKTPHDSPITEFLNGVLLSADRAADLVRQILTFSRRSFVAKIPLTLQPLVKESLKMLHSALPSSITIKSDIHLECKAILADPTQIHQIVMNLCTNAFHAMENTGGVLKVGLNPTCIESPTLSDGQQIKPGTYVELTVSDTGTGIGKDIIDKIFDPFFTTKEVGKGTGMGLSITHGIIKSYDGAIMVESTVSQGTTFHVYFPVIQGEVKATEKSQETPRGKERILFVDDEEILAKMGKKMLESLGYTVTAHSSSIEALEGFKKDHSRFDLVITDLTMPGLTGTELARQIRKISPDIPIIFSTGGSSLINKETAKQNGIRGLLLKPILINDLGIVVRRVIDETKDTIAATI